MSFDTMQLEAGRFALEGLCAILRDAPTQERVAAAHGLAIHGAPALGPLCEALRDKGILAKDTHDHTIRIAPPLVITSDQVDWALERIGTTLTRDFS